MELKLWSFPDSWSLLAPCNSFIYSELSHIFKSVCRLKHQDEENCCLLHFCAASVFAVGGRLCALELGNEKTDKAGKVMWQYGAC